MLQGAGNTEDWQGWADTPWQVLPVVHQGSF